MSWISVNDRLPGPFEVVWVKFEHGNGNSSKTFIDVYGNWQYNWQPTHWNMDKPTADSYTLKIVNSPIDTALSGLDILEKRFQNNEANVYRDE